MPHPCWLIAATILANSPTTSGIRTVARTAGVPAAIIFINWASRSTSVMMPTTAPSSTTGRQPTRWATITRAASSIGTSGSTVTTSSALTITSFRVSRER